MNRGRAYLLDDQLSVLNLRNNVWDKLTLNEKIFAYYFTLSGLMGKQIQITQTDSLGVEIRDLMEELYFNMDKKDPHYESVKLYVQKMWLYNGIYCHEKGKTMLSCSFDELLSLCKTAEKKFGAKFDLQNSSGKIEEKLGRLRGHIFGVADANSLKKFVSFYGEGVTEGEINSFNHKYPLNADLVKGEDGALKELVWRCGDEEKGILPGKYAAELSFCVKYLTKAMEYAPETTRKAIEHLIAFYKTGDPDEFRNYNRFWLKDTNNFDVVQGFIETYADPSDMKGSFESVLFYADPEVSGKVAKIGSNAQYFEDNMPWDDQFKKQDTQPLPIKIVEMITGCGDALPSPFIGLNLPNEQQLREEHGSKSFVISNVIDAYDSSDINREFALDKDASEAKREKYGIDATILLVSLHEVLGHGSGKTLVSSPEEHLPGYYATLEETRADLVALYMMWDPKLQEIGVVADQGVCEYSYDQYITNGLLAQLRRIGDADILVQDHMRCHQTISGYVYANGDCIEKHVLNEKTYFKVTDYANMRKSLGELLAEIMRIKGTGDLKAAEELIQKFGTKVDPKLREEARARAKSCGARSNLYFISPKLQKVVKADSQEIVDVELVYYNNLDEGMAYESQIGRKVRSGSFCEHALLKK